MFVDLMSLRVNNHSLLPRKQNRVKLCECSYLPCYLCAFVQCPCNTVVHSLKLFCYHVNSWTSAQNRLLQVQKGRKAVQGIKFVSIQTWSSCCSYSIVMVFSSRCLCQVTAAYPKTDQESSLENDDVLTVLEIDS